MVRSKLVYVSAIILACALVPYRQTIAPEWTVTTLDHTHRPLAGLTVREEWQQYSIEDNSHEEDRFTDDKGGVHFPRRTHLTTVGIRILGCARQVITQGISASCGAHSYLVVFGGGIDTMSWANPEQENGTTMPTQRSTLVLK
jgi:hypothetical protein